MPIYADIYDGPPRSYIDQRMTKRWIVIHSTQNDASAEGEAGYAKRRTDGISSHYYIDGDSIVQSLDTDLGAHHVGSSIGNRGGISYELTGFAAWSRARWLSSIAWPQLVAAVARDCAEHGVEPRELTVGQIQDGVGGIMTHNQARLAWGHTTHTDPGPGFPMDHLVDQVRQAMEDDMPTADEIADAVVDKLTHTVGEGDWAAKVGLQQPGTVLHPRKSLQYAWALSKGTYHRLPDLQAALAELAGQVAGLTELVRQLAAAEPVPLTPEQLAELTAAVQAAARAPGERIEAALAAAGGELAELGQEPA